MKISLSGTFNGRVILLNPPSGEELNDLLTDEDSEIFVKIVSHMNDTVLSFVGFL